MRHGEVFGRQSKDDCMDGDDLLGALRAALTDSASQMAGFVAIRMRRMRRVGEILTRIKEVSLGPLNRGHFPEADEISVGKRKRGWRAEAEGTRPHSGFKGAARSVGEDRETGSRGSASRGIRCGLQFFSVRSRRRGTRERGKSTGKGGRRRRSSGTSDASEAESGRRFCLYMVPSNLRRI